VMFVELMIRLCAQGDILIERVARERASEEGGLGADDDVAISPHDLASLGVYARALSGAWPDQSSGLRTRAENHALRPHCCRRGTHADAGKQCFPNTADSRGTAFL
jgi:hypothetical protein